MAEMSKRTKIIAAAIFVAVLIVALIGSVRSTPPTGDGVKVAFYGDSYTLGTGASDPANRWSTIVSAERNWQEFNPSVNGLGFYNNRGFFGDADLPTMVIQFEPEIVFVTMGLNDNFSFDEAENNIRVAIIADFELLARELPDARIIAVEPFWYKDERPDSVDQIIIWVEEAAARVGADYIPGASRWIEGHPEWMASDGLHPNDDGYAEIARRMNEQLRLLGL